MYSRPVDPKNPFPMPCVLCLVSSLEFFGRALNSCWSRFFRIGILGESLGVPFNLEIETVFLLTNFMLWQE